MNSNIWKEKKIAPFEYCTLDRAAKLLGCEPEDIIHWNRIGAISIAFKPKNLKGIFSIQLRAQLDADSIERYNKSCYIMSEFGFYGSLFNRCIDDKNDTGFIPTLNEFRFSGYASDLWTINNGIINEENKILITASFNKGYNTLVPVGIPESISSALFFYQNNTNIVLELKDLFVTRYSIEKIWESVISGNPMTSYFNSKKRENTPIPVNSVSIAQTNRHEFNRQQVEFVAKKVREHYPEECTKNGKLLLNKWVNATLVHKNDYGGMTIRSNRKISTILSEIIKAEKVDTTAK